MYIDNVVGDVAPASRRYNSLSRETILSFAPEIVLAKFSTNGPSNIQAIEGYYSYVWKPVVSSWISNHMKGDSESPKHRS